MSLESSFSRSRLAGMTKALCLRLLLLAAFSYTKKRKCAKEVLMETIFADPAVKALFQKVAASLGGISIALIEFLTAQGPDGTTIRVTPRNMLPKDFYVKYSNIRAYVFVGTAFQLA